jgi:hypothetical protein
MKPEDYLRALWDQLKGFSPRERDLLVEEISTHFESGEDDPAQGMDQEQRRQKLLSEMGLPEQMGKGFRDIHRPGRLIDYLLILIPTAVVYIFARFSLHNELLNISGMLVRVVIAYSIFCILMVAIGFLRRSLYLKLYWIVILGVWSTGMPGLIFGIQIKDTALAWMFVPGITYLTYSSFPPGGPWVEWILPSLILLLLLSLVVWMIWQVRHDLLTVAYASLLAILGVLSFYRFTVELYDSTVLTWIQNSYYLYAITTGPLASDIWHFVTTWIPFVFLGLFFLADGRDLRWLALAFSFCASGILEILSIRLSPYWKYCLIIDVLFPLLIVLPVWLLEKRKKVQWQYT